MASVLQRISQIKQPRGGYLPLALFDCTSLADEFIISDQENIGKGLIGTAVDYLYRFICTHDAERAFSVSLLGAREIKEKERAMALLNSISGLDDLSIINACKLTGYDVCFRSSISRYVPVENILPNAETIQNIRVMVNRCKRYFDVHRPIVKFEVTFPGGYTAKVDSGDADFITTNTLWDLKTSVAKPTSLNTLQLFMYYLLSERSFGFGIDYVEKIGIFNPRRNESYLLDVLQISPEITATVNRDVLGTDDKFPIPFPRFL
ncbi:hypothetical protein SDC9_128690 [bioreactor metagenome]|uniref:PD-(D/E)XK endonuclease-like domain-containing protein n=1 Tax=bioreactor metagenome TaxID=1076179 RepID=A0A645CXH3_9ZZZZ